MSPYSGTKWKAPDTFPIFNESGALAWILIGHIEGGFPRHGLGGLPRCAANRRIADRYLVSILLLQRP
jgi:hypothetical protein